MPAKKLRSIKSPAKYEALRKSGMSKERAARITNATTPGRTVKQARAIAARRRKGK